MNKVLIVLACVVGSIAGLLPAALAEESPFLMDRAAWLKLSTREKSMYVQGFTRGLAMGAAMPEISQFHVPGWKVSDFVLYTNRFYGNRLNASISVPFIYMIQSLDMQGSKHADIDDVVENFRGMTQVETVHWLQSTFNRLNKEIVTHQSPAEQDSYDGMLEDLGRLNQQKQEVP